MSIMSRFAIALAAGLVAAGLNALVLMGSTQQAGYVSFTRGVKQGDAVPAAALAKVAVPGKPAVVGRALVPWKDRGLLVQMRAPRDYAVGDVALQRDVRDAIRLAGRDDLALLRFPVIAVGDRFKRADGGEAEGGTAGRGAFVTVAVKRPDVPAKTGDSTEAVAARQAAQQAARRMIRVVTERAAFGKSAAEDRILGVAVFPRGGSSDKPAATPAGDPAADQRTAASPILQPAEDEMLLTVPLEGIESVPDVILVGGDIGFFMLPEYP